MDRPSIRTTAIPSWFIPKPKGLNGVSLLYIDQPEFLSKNYWHRRPAPLKFTEEDIPHMTPAANPRAFSQGELVSMFFGEVAAPALASPSLPAAAPGSPSPAGPVEAALNSEEAAPTKLIEAALNSEEAAPTWLIGAALNSEEAAPAGLNEAAAPWHGWHGGPTSWYSPVEPSFSEPTGLLELLRWFIATDFFALYVAFVAIGLLCLWVRTAVRALTGKRLRR
jgi:hypothetical protein